MTDVMTRDAVRVCERVDLRGLGGARVLITGASGLIGSHLLACLGVLRDGGMPLSVQAQVYSDPPPHVASLAGRHGFRIVTADLADVQAYAGLDRADVIVHAAGYAQPLRFMANPGRTLALNVVATLALLEKIEPSGHFQFLSSAEVYTGLPVGRPCTEDMVGTTTPSHPRAAYIEGKRAGETACHAFRSTGVHATAVRLGDVYGPGTRPDDKRALNSFIQRALTQGEIRLLDAGTAVRTYAYVSDAVEAMWRILLEGRDTVYNVGGHGVTTIAGLARHIGRIVGVPVTLGGQAQGVAGAPEALRLDQGRVEREFGAGDRIGLEDGLAATIEWQRHLYAAPR